MLRIVGAGLTALFVTASPLAYAQTAASAATPSAADWNTLTDMRIDVVKAALTARQHCSSARQSDKQLPGIGWWRTV